MPELQLGGKVIATQSGANNPVMASNVVMDNVNLANVNMDNVNINNALASATFPAGHILKVYYWRIPETEKSTPGSWAYNTTPTSPATYEVATTNFPRISTYSKIVGFASGHVDATGSTGAPTVVAITNGNSPGNIVFGAAYRHVRNNNQEPLGFNFAFEDDCTNQTDPANPQYSLRCHSACTSLYFSRMQAGSTPNNPYTVIFYEVKL